MAYYELRRILTGRIYIAEFDLTDDCNLRCKHCFHFRDNDYIRREQKSIYDWGRKFIELKKSGIRRVLLIGGEPSLRLDVIEEANKIFKYIDICTNGTYRIGDYFNQRIFVSVDGVEEYNDSVRGNGVFKKVMENYKNDKRVILNMTITKDNWQQLDYVLNLAVINDMIGVSCDIYTPSPDHLKSDSLYLNESIREEILSEFIKMKKKFPKHFLMNKRVIKWYRNPNHLNKPCYWRQAVKHYNPQLEERPGCVALDCTNCGCFAQANLSLFNMFLSKK